MKQPYVIAAAATLAVVTGGVLYWSMLPDRREPVDQADVADLTTPKVGTPASSESPWPTESRKRVERRHKSQLRRVDSDDGRPRLAEDVASDAGTQSVSDPEDNAPTAGSARDVKEWEDEVNQRVLGPRQWLAVATPEETARIQAILNAPMPYDPRVSPTDRRGSIAAVREEVEACVAQARRQIPGARGRFVVAWDVVAHQGVGHISAVEIDPVVGFEQNPELAACVLDRVQGKTFTAEHEGEKLQVQYPFFYDRN